MDFHNDPRRERIEPMHHFMSHWASWGRHNPVRIESMTYRIMCWIEAHAKRDKDIEEGIVKGEPIHVVDEDRERIAWKVEYLLTRPHIWQGHQRERQVLIRYYRDARPSWPAGKIGRQLLDCKSHEVEELVKTSLLYMSYWWREEL